METTTSHAGTIVVGVDGSDCANQALTWAAEQASMENRQLSIVHVAKEFSYFELNWLAAGAMTTEVLNAARADAQNILDEARQKVAWKLPDMTPNLVLIEGDARRVLIDMSAGAAMVVIGSRGRGAVKSLVLGSVSVSVSRWASCPVIVVRPEASDQERHGVMVGIDATEHSKSTLEFAYAEASLRRLPLTVLYCFWHLETARIGYGMVPVDYRGLEEQRVAVAEAMAGMAEKYPDVQVSVSLVPGLPYDALTDATKTMDLVVVGHHGSSFADGLSVGAMAVRVVENSTGIVAVVPERTPATTQ